MTTATVTAKKTRTKKLADRAIAEINARLDPPKKKTKTAKKTAKKLDGMNVYIGPHQSKIEIRHGSLIVASLRIGSFADHAAAVKFANAIVASDPDCEVNGGPR